MTVQQIKGNTLGISLPRKAGDDGNTSFDKVLSDKTSATEKGATVQSAQVASSPRETPGTVSTQPLVKIGTITSKNPTVSNLLVRNTALKTECWDIVYAGQNRDKAYTRILTGTDIYYDPATREILWGDMVESGTDGAVKASATRAAGVADEAGTACRQAVAGTAAEGGGVNENLADAVRSMMGKSYSDVDCYELVVAGLNNMGVRYFGQGGMGNEMVTGALQKGLPRNAYLNGEGLIRYSGSESYRKSFVRISDPARQAKQVMAEMAGHLEKGSILSFSTESRGHTGVVSNKDGEWTFINSGVMDHPVDAVGTSKGVGEESLVKEIENWFKLAAGKNESLVITVGRLSSTKLAAYGAGRELAVS